MLVLGINPGLAILVMVLLKREYSMLYLIDYGTVNTPAYGYVQRLVRIFDGVCEIMEHFRPDAVAIEELF